MLKVLSNWFGACRIKTIPAAICPIIIGSTLASSLDIPSLILILISAVLIQIATNLANDYFDYKNDADTPDRLGPVRATTAGLISAESMKKGIIITFSLAFIVGLFLVARGGWPILIIGLSSILAGLLYTGGPYPLGYNGLGDIFVLLFFGPIAVAGTVYLNSFEFSREIILIGLAPGLLSTAILAINNLRDVDEDRKTGKRTLAVILGSSFAKWEYVVCVITAVAIPIIIKASQGALSYRVMIILITLIPTVPLIKTVFTKKGKILNGVLAKTGLVMVMYAGLFYVAY
ncbi:1,4-dihydroxy-2-naphthoate polyprenyltransferase [Candidatus Marinamargulisbacteria bacterium SCGC AAA071-K20]|nr:1,4-dihydroxy-2-naphthoate polyprenyltransferase [Candidatus Marinamargulisbacteria bacterium SCGC AAA071-K20]